MIKNEIKHPKNHTSQVGWFLVLDATANNISVIYMVVVIFIGGRNWSIQRKPSTCLKSLTNFIT